MLQIDQTKVLPSNVFFRPTQAFMELAHSDTYRYALWLDCGAGMGHLGHRLAGIGVEVNCYDLLNRPSYEHPVGQIDCTTMYFARDDVVVLARPSHGPWVQKVLGKAARSAGRALYIGLEKNLKDDLPDMVVEHILCGAGEAGECVWRCMGLEDEVEEWHLLKTSFWPNPSWELDGGDRWYHSEDRFGHMHKPTCGEVLEVRKACRQDMLPSHWEPKSDDAEGWITPDGTWHGCGYHEHDNLVHDRFQVEVGRAEQVGFLRCREDRRIGKFFTRGNEDRRITPAQRRTLVKHGFTVYEDD